MQISREKRRVSVSDDEKNEIAKDVPDAFRSWGEVFDLATLGRTARSPTSLQSSTTKLTCWGSGQLNFRRASDEAILALARIVVQDGKARRVLQRYRSSPTASLPTLLLSEVSDPTETSSSTNDFLRNQHEFLDLDRCTFTDGPPLRTFTVMKRDADGVVQQQRFSL